MQSDELVVVVVVDNLECRNEDRNFGGGDGQLDGDVAHKWHHILQLWCQC